MAVLPSLLHGKNKDLIFDALLMNMAAQGGLLATYDDVAGAESVIVPKSGRP
jgi:hypothetical protein